MSTKRRLRLAFILLFFAAAFIAAAGMPPLILYNGSPSAPAGFYLRASETPRVGAFVSVAAVRVAPSYARVRGFDDRTDRFIKRVAAAAGARLCAQGDTVVLDEALVLARADRDSMGRPLPRWSGCRRLSGDEVLLLGDTADSFDGRYWGPTRLDDIEGVWRPLGRPSRP